MEVNKKMRKEIERKIYSCNGDKINRIEVCLVYNSDLKRYYISIQPQKTEDKYGCLLVSTSLSDCARVLLHTVTRRTKKQDKLALDKFLHDADNLAEQMAKRFDAVLKG